MKSLRTVLLLVCFAGLSLHCAKSTSPDMEASTTASQASEPTADARPEPSPAAPREAPAAITAQKAMATGQADEMIEMKEEAESEKRGKMDEGGAVGDAAPGTKGQGDAPKDKKVETWKRSLSPPTPRG